MTSSELAALRKLRRLVLTSVPSFLLLYPCIQLSIVFFLNDQLYQVTVRNPRDNTAIVDVLRREAAALATTEWFRCTTDRLPGFGKRDERELLLVALGNVYGELRNRRLQVPHTSYIDVVNSVEELDLALLRRGTAIDREYSRLYREQEDFELTKLDPLCKAQAERARFEEPLLPPIKAYAEAREILLRGASRREAALARYAEVRNWLRALFYAWIAYSVAGLVCGVWILRFTRRLRAELRIANDEPTAPPPTPTN